MTRITNFGSCAVDHVFLVPEIVVPGETLPSTDYQIHAGGKGLNQSLALASAGASVRHAGKVGKSDLWLKHMLDKAGVDTTLVTPVETKSGIAIIQVTAKGQNAIIVHGGANHTVTPQDIEEVLDSTRAGELLLIQNEISCLPELINAAAARNLRIVFNAAPITSAIKQYPLEAIEVLILNEIEGAALTGSKMPQRILDVLVTRYPDCKTILTLGEKGAHYADSNQRLFQAAFKVPVVDTTAAGDTFTGYFLAAFARDEPIEKCLGDACRAAALCVTKAGAASSIPRRDEFDQLAATLVCL